MQLADGRGRKAVRFAPDNRLTSSHGQATSRTQGLSTDEEEGTDLRTLPHPVGAASSCTGGVQAALAASGLGLIVAGLALTALRARVVAASSPPRPVRPLPPLPPSPDPPPPSPPPPSHVPLRLRVSGRHLLAPSGARVRLAGFNWQIISGATAHTDPGLVGQIAAVETPDANVARIVAVPWMNTDYPFQAGARPRYECWAPDPPYFYEPCFDWLDAWVTAAHAAGLWVVLAARGVLAAGGDDAHPQANVVRNEATRAQFFAMWRHVAARYAAFDGIAAYEILSEIRDKSASHAMVRTLYEGGCAAVAAVDAPTPCMVGSAPYYKLWSFSEESLLQDGNRNVIYTFDYFDPTTFARWPSPPSPSSARRLLRRTRRPLTPRAAPQVPRRPGQAADREVRLQRLLPLPLQGPVPGLGDGDVPPGPRSPASLWSRLAPAQFGGGLEPRAAARGPVAREPVAGVARHHRRARAVRLHCRSDGDREGARHWLDVVDVSRWRVRRRALEVRRLQHHIQVRGGGSLPGRDGGTRV